MSQVLDEDAYADRRRHKRRPVLRTAELMVRGTDHAVGCKVIDESYGGVQVELEKALELPDELMLKFSDAASQLVRRCWSAGNRAGYQFIEIVPAQRRIFDDMPSPGAEALPGQGRMTLNDYIRISGQLLDLTGEPVDWLYPAERIHQLLNDQAQMRRLVERGRKNGLFPLRRAADGAVVDEQHFFGPGWRDYWS